MRRKNKGESNAGLFFMLLWLGFILSINIHSISSELKNINENIKELTSVVRSVND